MTSRFPFIARIAVPVALCAIGGTAQGAPAAPGCAAGAVASAHVGVFGGRRLPYTACVGALTVRAPDGASGQIVYTAYLAAGAARRPLVFVWNGGPGADSRLLHFHALGPVVWRGGALRGNPGSALGKADLVFVDPVGTGFSRAANPAAASFYGTMADLSATQQVVEQWRKAYGRRAAPLYLAGESFGTWRASGVAQGLAAAHVPVAGVMLISGGIPLGERGDRALQRALSLPNRTATALALGALSPALQADPARTLAQAEAWARTVYAPALADPAALTPQARAHVVAGLALYQGLAPASIDPASLWVSPRQFRTGLRPGTTLGIFDMRQTAAPEDDAVEGQAILAYYRQTLGWRQGAYAGIDAPAPDAGANWVYDQAPITPESLARAKAGEGPPSPSRPWVTQMLAAAPALRVWVAAGRYDSLNSCAGNAATVASLPASMARRFTLRCYAGGHMMYEDPAVTDVFARDFNAFLQAELRK